VERGDSPAKCWFPSALTVCIARSNLSSTCDSECVQTSLSASRKGKSKLKMPSTVVPRLFNLSHSRASCLWGEEASGNGESIGEKLLSLSVNFPLLSSIKREEDVDEPGRKSGGGRREKNFRDFVFSPSRFPREKLTTTGKDSFALSSHLPHFVFLAAWTERLAASSGTAGGERLGGQALAVPRRHLFVPARS